MTQNDPWHKPVPGPQYWSWRCMECDEAVSDHPNWLKRLMRWS